VSLCSQLALIRTGRQSSDPKVVPSTSAFRGRRHRDHPATLSLGLPRALNNAAIAALIAAATAGKALVGDECAKKARPNLPVTRGAL
jgi:hypothetical protein